MIIDISAYQKKVDWKALKANNQLEAVYIKSTEGVGFLDPEFKNHITGAQSVNMNIGFYHFASLNTIDAMADSTAEATAFYNATKGIAVSLPYALDLEANKIKLAPDLVLKWIKNFVETFNKLRAGTMPAIGMCLYSYTPFLDANLPANHGLGVTLPLWIAAYTDKLQLPKGWPKAWLWQFTQKQVVAGIPGMVDCSKKI